MELKITGSLVVELSDFMDTIESIAGDYLLPNPEGLFLPSQCEPVLLADTQYYRVGKVRWDEVAPPVPIYLADLPNEDIYNASGGIVVTRSQLACLKPTTRHSLRARNMITSIFDHLIRSHARWTGTQARGVKHSNLHAAVRPFLLEQLQRSGVSVDGVIPIRRPMKRPQHTRIEIDLVSQEDMVFFYAAQDICDSILLSLGDLTRRLTDFLGQDRWIMYFMKVNNTVLTIERTIDYRIYSWMVEHGREFDE